MSLLIVVVEGSGPTLLGRNWMSLQLDWGSIKQLQIGNGQEAIGKFMLEFEEVFCDRLGTIRPMTAHLKVKACVQPRFCKPRSVPFSLKPALEADLSRLEVVGCDRASGIFRLGHSHSASGQGFDSVEILISR